MTTLYQSRKDSMDDIDEDEKGYSDDLDDESLLKRDISNNFMHQVHQQRRHSFSYSKQSDSPLINDENNNNNDYNDNINNYDDEYIERKMVSSLSSTHSIENNINSMNRQRTESSMDIKPTKLTRRHSADKVLAKPCTKNINSADYLNRMVISLRSRIATYKEDLRIAGELGQNLFSENAKKDVTIQQCQNDLNKLKQVNDELSNVKNQLLQTTQLDAEHTKRLETDLHLQMSSHSNQTTKYQEECIRLGEELEHNVSDVRHLTQLNERQRIEIETLETRNEQISQNAQETIDDLSEELAEEKDGHSTLKHKYQKLHNEYLKTKINSEKRGTEINNLKKQIQTKDLEILSSANDITKQHEHNEIDNKLKQQITKLYRQIDNYKDEMEGISKHLDYCKKYLSSNINYLESTALLMKSPFDPDSDLNIDDIYSLCKKSRQFLGIDEAPPDPVYPEESPDAPPPELPRDRSTEALPSDDNDAISPQLPRERTPEFKVSQKECVPLSVPAAPKTPTPPPSKPSQPIIPIQPTKPISPKTPKMKPKISNKPYIPPLKPSIPDMPSNINEGTPHLPLPRPKTPKSVIKTYNLGMMPTAVNISPSLPAPAIPQNRDNYNAAPCLPTEEAVPKQKLNINASAMAPPSIPPPMPSQQSLTQSIPIPNNREIEQLSSIKSGIQSNNDRKPKLKKKKSMAKKKKKSKKIKNNRDSMEEQKQHLTVFFSTYSDNKNWTEGGKENGVQKYILRFAEREPLNARMAFLYSMTLYLGQIVGVNKRCISHAFMLFKSVRAQIDTLCEEFALILQTLEHHNDDKLWKYVYSFLYNAAAYFKHIQRFVGTRTSVDNPRKYSRALKQGSRDYTNLNRRESEFRKLSGLSQQSGQSFDYGNHSNISVSHNNISNNNISNNHQIYGNIGNIGNDINSQSSQLQKKSNKKKKKSSYT